MNDIDITQAQYLDCTPAEYHKLDGFSSSIAKILLAESPLHAWQAHPLLGGKDAELEDPSKAQDSGSVMHHLLLGKGADYKVLTFDNYKTKKAQDERDAARAEGKIPILQEQIEHALVAAGKIGERLRDAGVVLDGTSEQAMQWSEQTPHGPVLCRGMMDHVTANRMVIYDFKIVRSAAPSVIERSAENYGYALQHAAYRSGHGKVLTALGDPHASRVRMLFVFCEPRPPYAVNVLPLDGEMQALGDRRWSRALGTWARCLSDQHWPGYNEDRTGRLSAPPWAYAREPYDDAEVA